MTTNTGWSASHEPLLPTSRAAAQQVRERGVLAILRSLMPRRLLTTREAQVVAELQANRLLELAGLPQAPVPNELITELPRIAETLAGLRGISLPALAEITSANVRAALPRLGRIP